MPPKAVVKKAATSTAAGAGGKAKVTTKSTTGTKTASPKTGTTKKSTVSGKSSTTGTKKVVAKAGAKKPAAAAAAVEPAPAPVVEKPATPPPPPEPVKGVAKVKYNHYNKEFPTLDGKLLWKEVDDEFCLSFAFHGNFTKRLREHDGSMRGGKEMDKLADDMGWLGLTDGATYVVECDEDPDHEDKSASGGIKWASGGPATAAGMTKKADAGMGEDSASCSCIEGNPCAVKYNCLDWANRDAVAKAARKKKGMAD